MCLRKNNYVFNAGVRSSDKMLIEKTTYCLSYMKKFFTLIFVKNNIYFLSDFFIYNRSLVVAPYQKGSK